MLWNNAKILWLTFLKPTPVILQANIGQDEDFKAAKEKAETLGAKKVPEQYELVFHGSF